jgi:hypothetical protein
MILEIVMAGILSHYSGNPAALMNPVVSNICCSSR